jgi:hypothetical protein
MIDEIDVHEERGFFICEAAFQTKETAVKRPVACATESGDQIDPVVGSESTDFDPASIAQRLYRGIFLNFRHELRLQRFKLAQSIINYLKCTTNCRASANLIGGSRLC